LFTSLFQPPATLPRFIIAGLTDASSIPNELEGIFPHLAVPVQPLLEGSSQPRRFSARPLSQRHVALVQYVLGCDAPGEHPVLRPFCRHVSAAPCRIVVVTSAQAFVVVGFVGIETLEWLFLVACHSQLSRHKATSRERVASTMSERFQDLAAFKISPAQRPQQGFACRHGSLRPMKFAESSRVTSNT